MEPWNAFPEMGKIRPRYWEKPPRLPQFALKLRARSPVVRIGVAKSAYHHQSGRGHSRFTGAGCPPTHPSALPSTRATFMTRQGEYFAQSLHLFAVCVFSYCGNYLDFNIAKLAVLVRV
jgi:hypothetical protein